MMTAKHRVRGHHRFHSAGSLGPGCSPVPTCKATYQLLGALINEELREGGVHQLHHKAQLAVSKPLQLVQGGAEVVVRLACDVQVSEREVQPANEQRAHTH